MKIKSFIFFILPVWIYFSSFQLKAQVGCSGSAAFTDSVPLIGCGITQMHYRDMSTGSSINGWQWNFGDGGSSSQQNPHHNYSVPGPYIVTLIVSNSGGCKDTLADSVFVPGPTATFSFSPNSGCPPLNVTFTVISQTATSYSWDFGDGTVISNSPSASRIHTYNEDMVVTPQLSLNSILPNGLPCTIIVSSAGEVTVDANLCSENIKELNESFVSIYPNPTNNIIHINMDVSFVNQASIELYNAIGQLIVKEKAVNESTVIDMNTYSNGIYTFRIVCDKKQMVHRIIKK